MSRGYAWLRTLVLILTLSAALIEPIQAQASTPVATPIETSQSGPVVGSYQNEFAEATKTVPTYELDLVLDIAQSSLGGNLMLTYPNQTGDTLAELPVRLYPNAAYYGEGETRIASIVVDGVSIAPRFDDSGTVLFLDLPAPLEPGETLVAQIEFTTVVPRNSSGSYGILNHDVADDVWVLADWYPVVAGRDETGWRLEPPTTQGDPTFSATGVFAVRLHVPDGYTVTATGTETIDADGTVLIDSGPVREFAMVVAKGVTTMTRVVDETEVSVVVAPEHTANGEHMLDLAAAALAFYNGTLGPYPFRELDFVEVPLALAYGVSWSGILFINENQLALPADSLASLDFTVLHEIGHQWWGGTVGANSNDHTWMVEGLTNATAVLAQASIQGPAAAADSLNAWIVGPYLNLLSSSGDAVADVSIFDQPIDSPLSTLAYGKGALGFLAIRNAIGDDAFSRALLRYADAFRLGIAEPTDLLAAFESASGQDLQALWTRWFESAVTTWAEVEALVPEIVASLTPSA